MSTLKERIGSLFQRSEEPAGEVPPPGPPHVQFALRLLQEMIRRDPHRNLVVSPAGVELVLRMVLVGAEGVARSELVQVPGMGEDAPEELLPRYRDWRQAIQESKQVEMAIGNSAWVHRGGEIRRDYVATLKEKYGAEVHEVDFASAMVAREINAWAREATRDRITHIVDGLDPTLRLVLINAIYFLGKWAKRFQKSRTKDRPFTRTDGSKKEHASMSAEVYCPYFRGPGFEAVGLAYMDWGFSMQVFLPEGDVASLLERQDNWMGCLSTAMLPRKGYLELPRFAFGYGAELVPVLRALGVSAIFDPSQRALEKIGPNMFVDDVRQKALVRVDEEGTEAAAVTHSLVLGYTEPVKEKPPFRMIVDRPFCFTVNFFDRVLFAGVVEEPQEE